MKKLTYGTYTTLLVIILLSALTIFSSCSNKHEQIATTLADADSLLNIDPEQSLELIQSLDTLGRLNKRNKAYRDYIYTSARYKAFYPIAEDSTIFSATNYFRRRGPQELYGKSLMMQGAVLYEQGKVEEAMETYKEAEPVLEEVGTYEDLGLLNTRIGELYHMSLVNKAAAIERFITAIKYFKLSDNKHRIASSYINYARVIAIDSLDKALSYAQDALSIFKEEKDTLLILSSYEILEYLNYENGHFEQCIKDISSIMKRYNYTYYLNNFKYNFYYYLTNSYIKTQDYNKAHIALENIEITNITDSISLYNILIDLSILEKDWETAYKNIYRQYNLSDSILIANYNQQLVEVERKYDLAQKDEELMRTKANNLSITLTLTIFLIITIILIILTRIRLKEKEKENEVYLQNLDILKEQLVHERALLNEVKYLPITDDNIELQKILGELISIIEDIGYTYSTNESNPDIMVEKVQNKIDEYLSKVNLFEILPRFINNKYPGMLDEILSINPKLSDDEKWLIYLLCSNFSTNTICIMTKLDDSKLKYRKNRLARKLNTPDRISTFLKKMMKKYGKTSY